MWKTEIIAGNHTLLYSTDSEADRVFLRDALKFPNVDIGDGWLIFGLPPSEVAVYLSDKNDVHEFYLRCNDVEKLIAEVRSHGIGYSPTCDSDWGILTQISLPGGGKLGIYQPKRARLEPIPS